MRSVVFSIYLSIYLYSSNNKQAICNTTKHTVGQDRETEILNTALNKKMTVTNTSPTRRKPSTKSNRQRNTHHKIKELTHFTF